MDNKLKRRLAVANAAFAQAKETVAQKGTGDFFKPEPGRYKVRITDGEVNESQSGRLQCFLGLTIAEGEFAGQEFRKYYGLDEKGLEFLVGDITRLERETPDNLELLEDLLKEIVAANVMVNIRVKENGEYLNTYFDRLVKDGDEPATPVAPKAAAPVAKPAPAPSPAPAPAPAAPAPAPEASAEGGDDIVVGRKLSVEGKGNGVVSEINEEKGLVTLKMVNGTVETVTVDKLGLPVVETPKPAAMRVVKK